MKIHHVAIAVALLLPSFCWPQSLCKKGEVDYFTCTTTNGKIISVCGNIVDGEIDVDSWLQYRFGKSYSVELVYPVDKTNSVAKFEGNYFNRYGVVDLRFINGKTLYGVELSTPYFGEDAIKRPRSSGGVKIELGLNKRVSIVCRGDGVGKYFGVFSQLNTSLSNYNGETDFLYKFLNHVSP